MVIHRYYNDTSPLELEDKWAENSWYYYNSYHAKTYIRQIFSLVLSNKQKSTLCLLTDIFIILPSRKFTSYYSNLLFKMVPHYLQWLINLSEYHVILSAAKKNPPTKHSNTNNTIFWKGMRVYTILNWDDSHGWW